MSPSRVDLQLRAAVESSPTGVLMIDARGRIVLVNREVERLFQFTREELVGQPVEVLVPERFRGEHPNLRDSFFADPKVRSMGAGRDLHGLRKDGTEVPVEIGLTPVETADGMFVVSSIVDVSARRRAEQRFRIAVESSPNGMVMIDGEGRIVLVNREIERMFGHARPALLGQSIEMLVPERYRERHPSHRAAYFAAPERRTMGAGRELFGLRADGTEIPVEIGLNPVETDDGVFVLGSVVDISERKHAERERRKLEEQLRQAQKMEAVGTLAGGIAHDFNNILAAINGYAELVQADLPADSPLHDDIAQVLKSADRGRQLVARILSVSRRQEPKRRPVALGPIIEEAVRLLRATLPSSIELRLVLDTQLPNVLVDTTSVHQILMNIGTNAAHAMPNGGTLTVATQSFYVKDSFARAHPQLHEGMHVALVVRDTGHGMPPAVLARALEPFFTTKAPGQGTGLGLSMVHAIMRDHDGIVELDSEPGRGSTVRCLFPAIETESADAPETAAQLVRGNGERVLYVDDESTLAEVGDRRLTALGYVVTAVTDSVLALEIFKSKPEQFDLVVTDYYMPKLSGLELASRLTALRPDIPIVLMTGFSGQIAPEGLEASGIKMIVPKPVTTRQLSHALRDLLADRPAS